MSRLAHLLAASTILCSVPAIVNAQETSEVQPNSNGVPVITPQEGGVYFRVPLETDTTAPNQPYVWNQRNTACSTQCGTGTKTVGYQCNDTATGTAVSNSFCTSTLGAVPALQTQACTVYSGCAYTWVRPPVSTVVTAIGSNPVGTATCGQVQATYSPYCQRSDGTVLSSADNNYCANSAGYPVGETPGSDGFGYNRTEIRTNSCLAGDFEWRVGNWSGWSSTCSDASTQTRSVTCVRKFDGSAQADSFCSAVAKPETTQTQGVYSTCAYGWRTAPSWSAWTSPSGFDPLCSADATRVRAVWCQRSDTAAPAAPGTTVADSFCSASGTKPSATETGNYAGCTFSWTTGPWSAWSIAGTNTGVAGTVTATRTRSVNCMRSDGTVAGSASCTGAAPGATESYALTTAAWSAWSSTCSDAATRVRSATCQFTSGSPATTTSVATSSCSTVGIVIGAPSETAGVYSGCSYTWVFGRSSPNDGLGWAVNPANYGETSQVATRGVWCNRSDGTTMGNNSNCETGATNGYPGWRLQLNVAWSGPSGTCTSSATSSQIAQSCQRWDGAAVDISQCTSAGLGGQTRNIGAVYSGCSYSWNAGAWSPWSVTNGGLNASRSRPVGCRRSDGADVADSFCSATGAKPATSETLAWNVGTYGAWSSTCSTSSIRTRSVTCINGSGTTQSDTVCNSAGMAKPATSEGPTTITSGCTNANTAPSGTCTADAASPTGYSRPATCTATSTNGTPISVPWTQCQGTAVGKMFTNGKAVCPTPITFSCYYWWPTTPPRSSHREHWLRWGTSGYPTTQHWKICLLNDPTQEKYDQNGLAPWGPGGVPIVQERYGSQRWFYQGQVYTGRTPVCAQNWANRTGPGWFDNIVGMETCN